MLQNVLAKLPSRFCRHYQPVTDNRHISFHLFTYTNGKTRATAAPLFSLTHSCALIFILQLFSIVNEVCCSRGDETDHVDCWLLLLLL